MNEVQQAATEACCIQYCSRGRVRGHVIQRTGQYHGAASQSPYDNRYDPPHNPPDPFADQNAIPLQNQGKMGESHNAASFSADPEARYRGEPKKKGWFSGRVTWVVYILTVVQVGVFVGEIIKNGTSSGTVHIGNTSI